MSESIWESTVTRVGSEAAQFLAAGVIILYGEPVPGALADVCLAHRGSSNPFVPIAAGDGLSIGTSQLTITELGSRANDNLDKLGHVVVYLNAGEQEILPGAVKAIGPTPAPAVGDRIVFTRAAHA